MRWDPDFINYHEIRTLDAICARDMIPAARSENNRPTDEGR